ncbi:sulfotransferase domain-containing protein [uncultured Winogradskyella sp.]|uniref:sulfotransferase domain-containing protein n=1 Tax=uncultured Winogradskyella sp. TaxID=395353 RepID=UPI0026098739|nr:sulfotransferase domain-containing protein [uncultured Winogradskyella sp.]
MIRIHAAYHKCLTMFFFRTANNALNTLALSRKKQYEHFESIQGLFYNTMNQYYLCSINNFAPNIDKINGDFRISRFVRDPRDLIVSGYFYHKRGAEPWFRFKDPTEEYWSAINGHVPSGMPSGKSFAEYLSTLNESDGLMKEIEFRKYHLESMRQWPKDTRIKTFRYEDIISDQVGAFSEILDHLQIKGFKRKKLLLFANRYALQNRKNDKHIRNPQASQWRKYFTPKMNTDFVQEYGDILERYGYPKE